jgi:putative endonuclease
MFGFGRTTTVADPRHSRGRVGERQAARFLRRKGHRIIARNYDCPAGEVDLITTDGPTIVFVEVKSRTDASGKDADHTVNAVQRERLIRAAQYFTRRADPLNRPIRFDVVTVYLPATGRPAIDHFENAFAPLPER